MRDGALPVPLDIALEQMADLAAWTARNAPRMTAVEVCTTPYHDAGATSVADVAFAVATGVDYLRALTAAGLDVETAAQQITFSMGLGCRFYLAIAKIRAARKLWADVIAASGGDAIGPDDAAARLHRPARADHAQPVAQHPAQHRRPATPARLPAPTSSPPRRSTRRSACRPRRAAAMRAIRSTSSPRNAIWRR